MAVSTELNPVERVWLYLRERFLSYRLLADFDQAAHPAVRRIAWQALREGLALGGVSRFLQTGAAVAGPGRNLS